MVRRTTWILLLVFGLMVVFAWVFTRYQANKVVATSTPTLIATTQKLYDLTNAQVTEVNISNNAGDTIDLYRDSSTSAKWAVKNIAADQADSVKIDTAVSQFLSLTILDALTQSPPLDSIGLASPTDTITMLTTDGKQIVTNIGSPTAIGTGYYIQVDSSPIVIVDKVNVDNVLNLLKVPPLLATATPLVTATETGTPIAPAPQATSTP
jgi:hypothetical protein